MNKQINFKNHKNKIYMVLQYMKKQHFTSLKRSWDKRIIEQLISYRVLDPYQISYNKLNVGWMKDLCIEKNHKILGKKARNNCYVPRVKGESLKDAENPEAPKRKNDIFNH